MIKTFLFLSFASLLLMVGVDYRLGAEAEFVNAFSVLERLWGRTPSVANSLVAREVGPVGELIVVMMINLVVGALLTWVATAVRRAA